MYVVMATAVCEHGATLADWPSADDATAGAVAMAIVPSMMIRPTRRIAKYHITPADRSVIFDGVVPVGDDVPMIGRPLHHSLAHQFVGAKLECDGLPGVQDTRHGVFTGHQSHQVHGTQ